MKTNSVKIYLNHVFGYKDDVNTEVPLCVSTVSDILNMAIEDNIQELEMTEDQFKTIRTFMVYNAQWNWDKKTFMGINFKII